MTGIMTGVIWQRVVGFAQSDLWLGIRMLSTWVLWVLQLHQGVVWFSSVMWCDVSLF